jgi:hypothetical protein
VSWCNEEHTDEDWFVMRNLRLPLVDATSILRVGYVYTFPIYDATNLGDESRLRGEPGIGLLTAFSVGSYQVGAKANKGGIPYDGVDEEMPRALSLGDPLLRIQRPSQRYSNSPFAVRAKSAISIVIGNIRSSKVTHQEH